jgi:1-acyl-sn-glycerol-3-phosphate acyltransferase
MVTGDKPGSVTGRSWPGDTSGYTRAAPGETRPGRWTRRVITVPGYLLAFALAVVLLPVLVPLAAAVDLVHRRRLATTRFLGAVTLYLAFETLGLAVLGWIFATGGASPRSARQQERLYQLERWWATALLRALLRLFGMGLETEGTEMVRPGPIVLVANHVSVADVLLPASLVADRLGIRLRYVAKRELLWDPCVDFAGHWLPNVFVRRGSADTPGDVARVQALLEGLGSEDGVFLFPEGTRSTPERRARLLAARAATGSTDLIERAGRLATLMPPRLSGVLGLLDRDSRADVIFMAHVGFDGVRRISDMWNGVLIGRTVRVAFWRCRRSSIPADREGRIDWLFGEWERLDAWVSGHRPAPPCPGQPGGYSE